MGSKLTWEWGFPSGEVINASLEFPSRVETVFLGPRLISRSPPGGRREGHTFALRGGETRVDFNADARECVLMQAGTMLPPSRVGAGNAGGSPKVALIVGLVLAAVFVFGSFFVTLAYFGVKKYRENAVAAAASSNANATLSESYDSTNSLLVAHYPSDFAATVRGANALQLMRGGLRDDSILLMSIPDPVSDDPIELGRVVVKPIVDVFPKKGGSYNELTRGPTTCLGHAGYGTTGTATIALETVKTWSCTFVLNGHGYIIFASVNADYAADEPLMRTIIDATEIVAEKGAGAEKAAAATGAQAAPSGSAAPRAHKGR